MPRWFCSKPSRYHFALGHLIYMNSSGVPCSDIRIARSGEGEAEMMQSKIILEGPFTLMRSYGLAGCIQRF